MATLYYRDPATQDWVTLAGAAGPTGPTGPTGPGGPTVVSTDANNAAIISATDGLVYVPGVDTTAMDTQFVNLAGDTMTGELSLPDQIATPPTAATTVAAKGYVDQVITVSDVDPTGAPVRDGLIWNVVGDAPTQQPTTTTLAVDVATVAVGGVVTLTADTTADTGTIQFKKDGANLGTPVAVNATGGQ